MMLAIAPIGITIASDLGNGHGNKTNQLETFFQKVMHSDLLSAVRDVKLESEPDKLAIAISIIALLVSGLSALYSRWTWKVAKKSNFISLLPKREEIYEALKQLHYHVSRVGTSVEFPEVARLYVYKGAAAIYYPEMISKKLEQYLDTCYNLAVLNSLKDSPQSPERRQEQHDAHIREIEIYESLVVLMESFLKHKND